MHESGTAYVLWVGVQYKHAAMISSMMESRHFLCFEDVSFEFG
jgi:hypothetical protein